MLPAEGAFSEESDEDGRFSRIFRARGREGRFGRAGCLVDGRTYNRRGFFEFGEGRSAPGRVDNAEVRVMDRLPHPADRIDETLIRVEWPDPTGKYTRPAARHDKSTADYA